MLLVGTPIGKAVFERVSRSIGFPVRCMMSCPGQSTSLLESNKNKGVGGEDGKTASSFMSRRVSVPVILFPPAANENMYMPFQEEVKQYQELNPSLVPTNETDGLPEGMNARIFVRGETYNLHKISPDFTIFVGFHRKSLSSSPMLNFDPVGLFQSGKDAGESWAGMVLLGNYGRDFVEKAGSGSEESTFHWRRMAIGQMTYKDELHKVSSELLLIACGTE